MSVDQPLPISVKAEPQPVEEELETMGALHIGSIMSVPEVAGRWSVWSQSNEAPGAHFLIPIDDEAKAIGAKYLVIRAVHKRDSTYPLITVLRADPHIKGIGA
jgi:hypothetical protein